MADVRQDEIDSALEKLQAGVQHIHISGEPGVGKSTFLDDLVNELPENFEYCKLIARKSVGPPSLTRDMLVELEEALDPFTSFTTKLSGAQLGIGPISAGFNIEDNRREIKQLADLSKSYKKTGRYVLGAGTEGEAAVPESDRQLAGAQRSREA